MGILDGNLPSFSSLLICERERETIRTTRHTTGKAGCPMEIHDSIDNIIGDGDVPVKENIDYPIQISPLRPAFQ
jgi:hypothetical protein